ncbi:glutamyl-tRNA reductase [Helicobacter suis]|uniref:glutamyl-tRNA reductase n=1 Tax=Helicobacter suis TaxID=104628 RepID=UPI0013D7B0FC|nr:glutamyl-tRNA reductase [Helicobacter suis]
MNSGYVVVSFTHQNLPVELREQLAFSEKSLLEFLSVLKQHSAMQEIMALATCNRMEFYIFGALESVPVILESLARAKNMPLTLLQEKSVVHAHNQAIHHTFSVVSSLESMVVGETQITGQFKSAYKTCLEAKLCGKHLSRLAHFAFKCAASVRNTTAISAQVVSIASMAVKQALEVLESEKLPKKALVVGVGEMGQLVCKHLLSKGFEVALCNRSLENARTFAQTLGAENLEVHGLENLNTLLNACPFVFSATRSKTPLITPNMLESTTFRRFWFDLAVPRDIEDPKDAQIWLYSIDDLKGVIAKHLEEREQDRRKAYGIVGAYTIKFLEWLQTLELDPLIKGLRELAKEAALKELNKALKKGYIPQEQGESVAKILHNAFNTFLHHPTAVLKKNAHKEEGDMLSECLKNLFNLGGENMFLNAYHCEYSKGL